MDREILPSVKEAIKARFVSPIYGTFILFWSLFHWDFLFTMFFANETLILQETGLLKHEYLMTFFDVHTIWFYVALIAPFVLTYVFIVCVPKWLLPIKKSHLKNKRDEYEAELDDQKLRQVMEIDVLTIETEKAKKESELQKVEKKIEQENPEEVWRREFLDFKQTGFYKEFYTIVDSIYKHRGYIEDSDAGTGKIYFQVPQSILVYAHTSGIIDVDKRDQRIDLTDKGKFFVKMYTENINKF